MSTKSIVILNLITAICFVLAGVLRLGESRPYLAYTLIGVGILWFVIAAINTSKIRK